MASSNLGDIYSAVSIILVFITILLDVIIREAVSYIQTSVPDSSKKKEIRELSRKGRKISRILILVLLFYTFIFYLLFPNTYRIIKLSQINFWNFDLANTLYVFINFCLLGFMVITIYYLRKIYKKS